MPSSRDESESDDYDEPPESAEDEGSIRIHDAYLEHRLGGGDPATPEAFRRAVEQFEQLPGAIRTGPASRSGPTTSPERLRNDERGDTDHPADRPGPEDRP